MTDFNRSTLSPEDNEKIRRIVELNLATLKDEEGDFKRQIIQGGEFKEAPQGLVLRGQHPKHHGLVTANFEIDPNIPAELRHGVFANGGTFDALIRFSNGRSADDTSSDAHGMAIKLTDVSNQVGAASSGEGSVQDFVLVDREVFFMRDLDDLLTLSEILANLRARDDYLETITRALVNVPLLIRLIRFISQTPASPLTSNYWSTTPYRLGPDNAVHYVAKTPRAIQDGAQDEVDSKDGLATELSQALATESVTFEFGVDVQTDSDRQPIEDATVNWRKQGADYVKLATITIPQQRVETGSAAENIVFSPWQSLPEHHPLGSLNIARGVIYQAMSDARTTQNGV